MILYRNVTDKYSKWIHGKIKEKLSSIRYLININGVSRVAHINQMKKYIGKSVTFNPRVQTYVIERENSETIVNEDKNVVDRNEFVERDRGIKEFSDSETTQVELRRSNRINKGKRLNSN